MSSQEKRFIVVSPSHHKKPRTMFLNKTNSGKCVWCDAVPYISTLWLLSDAQAFAVSSPVAIWFIEDKFWISTLEAGDMPKFADMLKYAQKAQCEIIRYLPQDQIPLIVAPSERELADDALREIAARLHDFTAICITSDKPIATLPEGERDDNADYLYLLYTLTADNQITYYRSENPRQTLRRKKQVAEVFTKVEAQAKTTFADEDGCTWLVEKVNRNAAKDDDNDEGKEIISALKQTFGNNPKVITLPKEEEEEGQYIAVSFKPISAVGRELYALFLPLKEPNISLAMSQPTHFNQPCYDYKNANFFTNKAAAVDFGASIGFFVYKVTDKQKEMLDFMYSLDRQVFGNLYPTILKDVFLYTVGEASLLE